VQERINHLPRVFDNSIQINLWDGLSGVRGYRAIRWLDAIFYKTAHIAGASWDTALQYNANRIYSLLSRRFSGWSYASSRLYLSPFVWIDEGQSEFEKARPPVYVAEQLAAFRKWGIGGEFANYAYRGLRGFGLRAVPPGDEGGKRTGTGRLEAAGPLHHRAITEIGRSRSRGPSGLRHGQPGHPRRPLARRPRTRGHGEARVNRRLG
jgi:hypothetical protein